jgi:hypothetical protein
VPIRKAQGLVTGGGEAEQAVGPVVNAQNAFFKKCTHVMCLGFGWARDPMPMEDAESLLQLRPARPQKRRCCCTNNAYSRVNRFQLEIQKFYIRITSAS